jgi:segregation and condensation protein B
MNELSQQIEALLFALGGPLTRDELQKQLHVSPQDLEAALTALSQGGRGIVVVDDGTAVELRTSAATASLVERIRKEEYAREIGRAGQETLAAILYRGPLTRSEIDFIRGVNSSQTLRTLTMRGLVRRVPNPKDERSFLYEPTTELLAQLGVGRMSEVSGFSEIRAKLQALEDAYRAKEAQTCRRSECVHDTAGFFGIKRRTYSAATALSCTLNP